MGRSEVGGKEEKSTEAAFPLASFLPPAEIPGLPEKSQVRSEAKGAKETHVGVQGVVGFPLGEPASQRGHRPHTSFQPLKREKGKRWKPTGRKASGDLQLGDQEGT